MAISESTSSSLLRRAQEKEPSAWQRLATLYGPLVFRWARRVGLSEHDAADVGQEVFRVVALKIGEFQATGSGFRAWLHQICRNKIGDFIRDHRKQAKAVGGSGSYINDIVNFDMSVDTDEEQIAEEQKELFSAALSLMQTDFEERSWQAFWRATIDEQPVQRIAEELGMTTKAVRQAKYRVLKRLREEFGDLLT